MVLLLLCLGHLIAGRQTSRISGTFTFSAAVDEQQEVFSCSACSTNHTDERQDQRQPVGQVHQPVGRPPIRKYNCRRPISANAFAVKTIIGLFGEAVDRRDGVDANSRSVNPVR